MSRRDSREAAVKIIFQNEFLDKRLKLDKPIPEEEFDAEAMMAMYFNSITEEELAQIEQDYVKAVLEGVVTHIEEIDGLISENTKDWTLDRMAKVDLAILRVAIFEMKYMEDIPVSVSINEAVELAKSFSYPDAGSFVNGVLGSISRK